MHITQITWIIMQYAICSTQCSNRHKIHSTKQQNKDALQGVHSIELLYIVYLPIS